MCHRTGVFVVRGAPLKIDSVVIFIPLCFIFFCVDAVPAGAASERGDGKHVDRDVKHIEANRISASSTTQSLSYRKVHSPAHTYDTTHIYTRIDTR